MKIFFSLGLFLFSIICNATQYSISHFFSDDRTEYTFEVSTGVTDHWNSEKDENPPLSAKKAMDIATKFMGTIPSHKNIIGWDVDCISLKRISKLDQEEEEWIYEVRFRAKLDPSHNYAYLVPFFTVIVRLDGSIPKPKIEKREQK